MSSTQQPKVINQPAGEDLRTDVYKLLKYENDGGTAKVIKTVAATDVGVAVLAENPRTDATTDGETVPVALISAGGVLVVQAGGTITAGQVLIPDASIAGTVQGVASVAALAVDQVGIGIALESAVVGQQFKFLAGVLAAANS